MKNYIPLTAARTVNALSFALLCSLATLSPSAKAEVAYYAAPDGSGNGLSASSPTDLVGARALVRANNDNMTDDIVVYLRGGIYELDQTFVLDHQDSGTNGHSISWSSYAGEVPIISGGKQITGWTQVSGEDYYSASVSTSNGYPEYFRQIWVDGRRARQAAGPFITPSRTNTWNDSGTPEAADGFYVDSSDIQNYTNTGDLRIFWEGRFKHVEQVVLDIIDVGGGESVFKMKQKDFDKWSNHKIFDLEDRVRVINAFEELDEPGEFYLNQTTDTIYYFPHPGEDMTSVQIVAPKVEYLWRIEGAQNERVTDLRIEGITFRYGNWNHPDHSEIGRSQADLMPNYQANVPGQVWLNYTDRVEFTGCRVERMASGGIELHQDNHDTLIAGNIFVDLTAAAVLVGHWPAQAISTSNQHKINTDISVFNNVVRATGLDYYQASGIYANTTKNLKIHHNDVADVAYFGINQRYSGNSLSDTQNLPNSVVGDTEFFHNRVVNYGTAAKYGFGLDDEVAGLYFFGVKNSRIHRNYVAHGGRDDDLAGGIRQDQYGVSNTFDFNVAEVDPVERSISSWNNASEISGMVRNNNFANVLNDPNNPATITNFQYEPNAPAWSPSAQAIIDAAGLESNYQFLLEDISTGWNIAAGKPASASTNFNSNFQPGNAVDVDRDTLWHNLTSAEGGSHSWWQTDLLDPHVIEKIQIVARYNFDQPSARRNFEVRASNDPAFATYTVLGGQADQPFAINNHKAHRWAEYPLNTWDLYVADPGSYRYLRVQKTESSTFNFAEFRAYGYQPTAGGSDTTPPNPDPATFASAPTATSSSAISMTATTGSDASGTVEYYFDETSGNPGASDSGWQSSASYTDSGLDPNTPYTYRVKMRDAYANETAYSNSSSTTTQNTAVLTLEAESGSIDGNFTVVNDGSASNGAYVYGDNSVGVGSSNITLQFTVTEAGTYRIRGWGYAPTGNDNSFWVSVNGGSEGWWEMASPNTNFASDWVNEVNVSDPREFSLSPGTVIVNFRGRENGTGLDKVELVKQ